MGLRGCWQDYRVPGITMRGPGSLAASPAVEGIAGGGQPGGGQGRGLWWEGRAGRFVHSCLRKGLQAAQGLWAGEGAPMAVRAKGWGVS